MHETFLVMLRLHLRSVGVSLLQLKNKAKETKEVLSKFALKSSIIKDKNDVDNKVQKSFKLNSETFVVRLF